MKALIVYDSVYGNTQQIAQAIGKALGTPEDVQVVRVSNLQPGQRTGLDWLIVGSPTHGGQPSETMGKWLGSLPANALQGIKVAAFDTRTPWEDLQSGLLRRLAKIFGVAAPRIAGKLQKAGGTLALPPEGFGVKDKPGPLKDGELEHATAWAKQIAGA